MTRGERLRRWMRDLGVSQHEVGLALSVPTFSVQAALRDAPWFSAATERRLRQWLEVGRDEFAVLE